MRFAVPQTATAIVVPASATEIIQSQPQNTIVETITFELPSRVPIIPSRVFDGCISLRTVCIPTSVTKIDRSAFGQCDSLSVVYFASPAAVTEFGAEAFGNCISLEFISIPSSVVHIRDLCFDGDANLADVIFESPSQLISIGSQVFQDCSNLYFFFIPPRLQIIDGMSFTYSGIIYVEVDPENEWFRMADSYLINLATNSIVTFFSEATSAVVPSTIHELGLESFADRISLTAISFESPSIVGRIMNCSFLGCTSLQSICIPASVRYIGDECFTHCENLVSVTFEQPSTIEIIRWMAFTYCTSLTQISVPASIQEIGSHCFHGCESFTSITFESPSNLYMLSDLGDLMLSLIEVPDSVEVIKGVTASLAKGSLVVSFGPESKLSALEARSRPSRGIAAFVRYSEGALRRFRENVDDFAPVPNSDELFRIAVMAAKLA
jgi:hypothetical protein